MSKSSHEMKDMRGKSALSQAQEALDKAKGESKEIIDEAEKEVQKLTKEAEKKSQSDQDKAKNKATLILEEAKKRSKEITDEAIKQLEKANAQKMKMEPMGSIQGAKSEAKTSDHAFKLLPAEKQKIWADDSKKLIDVFKHKLEKKEISGRLEEKEDGSKVLHFGSLEEATKFFKEQAKAPNNLKFLCTRMNQKGGLDDYHMFSCGDGTLYQGKAEDIEKQLGTNLESLHKNLKELQKDSTTNKKAITETEEKIGKIKEGQQVVQQLVQSMKPKATQQQYKESLNKAKQTIETKKAEQVETSSSTITPT